MTRRRGLVAAILLALAVRRQRRQRRWAAYVAGRAPAPGLPLHRHPELAGYEHFARSVWRGAVVGLEETIARVEMIGAPAHGVGEGRPPVLLVGGYANDQRVVGAITRSLHRDGFDATAITMPHFGMGDIRDQAARIRREVARTRSRTGAERIDIVGFSSGGFAARVAAQLFDGDAGVGRIVTVATAHAGIHAGPFNWLVDLIVPQGVRQVRRGGELIRELHASRSSVDVVSIGTRGFDGVIPSPNTSYVVEGKPFIAVDEDRRLGPFSRVTHLGITRDARTYEAIRDALLAPRTRVPEPASDDVAELVTTTR